MSSSSSSLHEKCRVSAVVIMAVLLLSLSSCWSFSALALHTKNYHHHDSHHLMSSQTLPRTSSALSSTASSASSSSSSPGASFSRRNFLATSSTSTTAAAVLTLSTLFSAPCPAAAVTPEAARDQWKRALTTLDDLLDNWSTISNNGSGGGDAIRTQLGTQGTTSPLFQIDKVLKVLRDDADDFIEFQETADEFQLALARADSMAYSANFAGGSGKPTPPAVYIEKAKTETIELRRIAKALNALL